VTSRCTLQDRGGVYEKIFVVDVLGALGPDSRHDGHAHAQPPRARRRDERPRLQRAHLAGERTCEELCGTILRIRL
jgi:hypothetical protein